MIYYYDSAGRLWKKAFPNGNHFIHSYYGTEAPEQIGRLKSIQLCLGDCTAVDEFGNPLGTPVFGYEYRYDRLGRVVWSREQPSGDETVDEYSSAGRLVYEGRTGDVGYWRLYSYQLDGSRAWVWRYDNCRGEHFDWYSYDTVSGRLTQVEDAVTGAVNYFVWNPEGTLARWSSNQPNSYARVFGYDEEGRLTRIERDDGTVPYEYGYNSDGVRVWKRDGLAEREYRYVCRIGCGGVPMRVYNRTIGSERWASVEDYLPVGNALGYNGNWRFAHTGGTLLMMTQAGEPWGYYPQDSNGLAVRNGFSCSIAKVGGLVNKTREPRPYGHQEGARSPRPTRRS